MPARRVWTEVAVLTDLQRAMADVAARVEKTLDRLLPKPVDTEARLFEAMRYATLAAASA